MTPADWRRLAEHIQDAAACYGTDSDPAPGMISVPRLVRQLRKEAERVEADGPLARLKAAKESRPFVITHNHEPCLGCELDFQLLRRVVDTLIPPTKEQP